MRTVELAAEQWDLVVLALEYVHARAQEPASSASFQPIDLFGRRIVRRRLRDVLAIIHDAVPEAGTGEP